SCTLSKNRPGRNRTCNPRFWSALPATPALKRLLIFNDLAPSPQRPRCWTTPALALILTLRKSSATHPPSEDCLAAFAQLLVPPAQSPPANRHPDWATIVAADRRVSRSGRDRRRLLLCEVARFHHAHLVPVEAAPQGGHDVLRGERRD